MPVIYLTPSTIYFLKFDVVCLLPLDLLYFATGFNPIWRLPRLLKGHSYNEFVEKFENKSKSANSFRFVGFNNPHPHLNSVQRLLSCDFIYVDGLQ